jgi:hypothetical protein
MADEWSHKQHLHSLFGLQHGNVSRTVQKIEKAEVRHQIMQRTSRVCYAPHSTHHNRCSPRVPGDTKAKGIKMVRNMRTKGSFERCRDLDAHYYSQTVRMVETEKEYDMIRCKESLQNGKKNEPLYIIFTQKLARREIK